MELDPSLADEDYCYLTTTGRVPGNPHEIEIWFSLEGSTVYMMNGTGSEGAGQSDWVRNLRAEASVTLRLRGTTYSATARVVEDAGEGVQVRELLVGKYGTEERPLDEWRPRHCRSRSSWRRRSPAS